MTGRTIEADGNDSGSRPRRTSKKLDALADAIRRESEIENRINDGGPAFPQDHLDGPHVNPGGMSLLHYFAGQALANSAIAHSNLDVVETAKVCVKQAIAVIEELERIDASIP